MKQMEYTVKVVTNGTVESIDLQTSIAGLQRYDIHSVTVTNFRVLPKSKPKEEKS